MSFDFDHVEDSNRTRMIGSRPEDAAFAVLKTDVINRLILSINPTCANHVFPSTWQDAAEHLRTATVIFGCVDKLSIRDELEQFSRKHLIPYIDIGMDVHKSNHEYSVSGQVALSLPGGPCLRCMGIVTNKALELEYQGYGAAGGRPQVIWPNGVLASTAIGQYMAMILPWENRPAYSLLKEYDGNRQEITESQKSTLLSQVNCSHYPLGTALGDPFFKISSRRNATQELKPAA